MTSVSDLTTRPFHANVRRLVWKAVMAVFVVAAIPLTVVFISGARPTENDITSWFETAADLLLREFGWAASVNIAVLLGFYAVVSGSQWLARKAPTDPRSRTTDEPNRTIFGRRSTPRHERTGHGTDLHGQAMAQGADDKEARTRNTLGTIAELTAAAMFPVVALIVIGCILNPEKAALLLLVVPAYLLLCFLSIELSGFVLLDPRIRIKAAEVERARAQAVIDAMREEPKFKGRGPARWALALNVVSLFVAMTVLLLVVLPASSAVDVVLTILLSVLVYTPLAAAGAAIGMVPLDPGLKQYPFPVIAGALAVALLWGGVWGLAFWAVEEDGMRRFAFVLSLIAAFVWFFLPRTWARRAIVTLSNISAETSVKRASEVLGPPPEPTLPRRPFATFWPRRKSRCPR